MAAVDINYLVELMTSTKLKDGSDDELPEDVQSHRTQSLRAILNHVQELRQARSLDDLIAVTGKLATGSRDASWRIPLGDSGILNFCLDLLVWPETAQVLRIQALRLVGNSCADTDENRARILGGDYISAILKLLSADDLVPFVIPSLYNICVDYEPAQAKAAEAGLAKELAKWLQSQRVAKAPHLVGIAAKTIRLLESTEHEKASPDTFIPITLLQCASSPHPWPAPNSPLDIEDFVGLASTATAYLTPDRITTVSASPSDSHAIYTSLEVACTRFSCTDVDDDDLEDANQLTNIRKSLVGIIADLSSQPSWSKAHPERSDMSPQYRLFDRPGTNTDWLAEHGVHADWLSKHHSPLQEAACLTFGNLACSDARSEWLVSTLGIHKPLISLLTKEYPYTPGPDDAAPGAVLHSAIGLLKNLAIPAMTSNRTVLGEHLLGTVSKPLSDDGGLSTVGLLPFIWSHEETQPQTQLATISLCRLLLSTFANAILFCEPLPAATYSSDKTAQEQTHPKTQIHALMEVFNTAPTEPTKTEAARAALALLKLLGGSDSTVLVSPPWQESSPEEPLAKFLECHAGIHDMLAFLLTQSRFPALSSEAWFVLALLGRRRSDGAPFVAQTLASREDVFAELERAVNLQPDQAVEDATGEMDKAKMREEEKATQSGIEDPMEALPLAQSFSMPENQKAIQAAQMARLNRSNMLAMIVELLKSQAALKILSENQKTRLQELVQTGGRMYLGEQGQLAALKFVERQESVNQ